MTAQKVQGRLGVCFPFGFAATGVTAAGDPCLARKLQGSVTLLSGVFGGRRRSRQHLVDPAPVEIDDFETPALIFELFSGLR